MLKKGEAGYILLDALIGAVFASLMVAMLGCVVMQSRMLQAKEYHMAAEYLARQQLDSLCWDEVSEQQLAWEKTLNGIQYHVTGQIAPLANAQGRHIHVVVAWAWQDRPRELVVEKDIYE